MKILLVDDEPDILEIIGYNLSSEGYEVLKAENGQQAIDLTEIHQPDLILLDVMMPGMDGVEACERIRSIPCGEEVVIAFLSARGEDYSQVAGFDAGADDYIIKPIKPKVLISKVKALLRRKGSSAGAKNTLEVGDLTIDRDTYKVRQGEREIPLPRKEFELLSLLASQPGKVFKRDVILNSVWGHEVVVGGRTIDVHIRKLREKIGSQRFETVKGVGYKLVE